MAAPLVLFDLNGTLLDPAGLAAPWGDGHRDLALRALDEAVEQAMVDTLGGVFRPFSELVRPALARQARLAGLDPQKASEGVQRSTKLDPFPDARAALEELQGAGRRIAVLTNSGREKGREAVENAGLADLVEDVRGTDEVERYKPHPEPYRHALGQLGADATTTWMVAGHGWDVSGAKRAGLRTCWISRDERVLSDAVPEPDAQAADLAEAANAVIAAA